MNASSLNQVLHININQLVTNYDKTGHFILGKNSCKKNISDIAKIFHKSRRKQHFKKALWDYLPSHCGLWDNFYVSS